MIQKMLQQCGLYWLPKLQNIAISSFLQKKTFSFMSAFGILADDWWDTKIVT